MLIIVSNVIMMMFVIMFVNVLLRLKCDSSVVILRLVVRLVIGLS